MILPAAEKKKIFLIKAQERRKKSADDVKLNFTICFRLVISFAKLREENNDDRALKLIISVFLAFDF